MDKQGIKKSILETDITIFFDAKCYSDIENRKYIDVYSYLNQDRALSTRERIIRSSALTKYLMSNGHEDFIRYIDEMPNYCFAYSDIETLNIPKNITFISETIVQGCKKLTKITVDEKNPYYDSRDNCNAVIQKDSNVLICGCKKTIIPSSVASIRNGAFEGIISKSDLNEYKGALYLPQGGNPYFALYGPLNKTIRECKINPQCEILFSDAFWQCSKLEYVEIPWRIKHIPFRAFSECHSLYKVIMPSHLETIELGAFGRCESLKEIKIPEGITTIENLTFHNAFNLRTVYFPSTLKEIVLDAFSSCSFLNLIVCKNMSFDDFQKIKKDRRWLPSSIKKIRVMAKDKSVLITPSGRVIKEETNKNWLDFDLVLPTMISSFEKELDKLEELLLEESAKNDCFEKQTFINKKFKFSFDISVNASLLTKNIVKAREFLPNNSLYAFLDSRKYQSSYVVVKVINNLKDVEDVLEIYQNEINKESGLIKDHSYFYYKNQKIDIFYCLSDEKLYSYRFLKFSSLAIEIRADIKEPGDQFDMEITELTKTIEKW